MRPDKKKTRHHDSQKSKKKALEKAASKAGPNAANTTKEPPKRQLPPPQPKIVNNWTHLEIPSEDEIQSDDNDWGDTGPKFEYVLQNADKSHSHFRTKVEKEWVDRTAHFTSEFFSLDVHGLNSAISRVPLQEILDIQASDISDKFAQQFNKEATKRLQAQDEEVTPGDKKSVAKAIPKESDEILKKAAQLSIGEKKNPPSALKQSQDSQDSSNTNNETEELEEWLDNFLED